MLRFSMKRFGLLVSIPLFFSSLSVFASPASFSPLQNPEDISAEVLFLTQTAVLKGNGDFMTVRDDVVPRSYYDGDENGVSSYWGGYVCDQWAVARGLNCDVIDTPHAMDTSMGYLNGGNSSGSQLQLERTDVHYGADIYDAACWQMALALAAQHAVPGLSVNELYRLIENQNRRLMLNDVRGSGASFKYGYQHNISSNLYAYVFRMLGTAFLSVDPLMQTSYEHYIHYDGGQFDPNNEDKDIYFGKTTWSDYKPITGENGWAIFLGPLQSDHMRYASQGYIPFAAASMQNAMNTLYAFQRMQAKNGAIFYAPGGSAGNEGSIKAGAVSTENCASTLAGLNLFRNELSKTLKLDTKLNDVEKKQIQASINVIDIMIWGGKSPSGDSDVPNTAGLLSYFKTLAITNSDTAVVAIGGFVEDGLWNGSWSQDTSSKAVDVSTWGIAALGPKIIDSWYGPGKSYKIWQQVKTWGAYKRGSELWGVGYSNDVATSHIMSAEWTAGAINAVRMMLTYYSEHPEGLPSGALDSLKQDHDSMMTHLMNLRTDKYLQSSFEDAVPAKNFVSLPNGEKAFLYASKRYHIPFGWYANPLPSTTSTSWAIYLFYNFNPFTVDGSYQSADWTKPQYDPNQDQGPWGIGTVHHVTFQNEVLGAPIMVSYSADCGGNYVPLLNQPIAEGGASPVTIPADACTISVSYNKTPENNQSWYGACQLDKKQIGALKEGQTVDAIWTNAQGSGACRV